MAATLVSSNKVFSGFQKVFKHASSTLGAEAKFGIFLPKSDGKVSRPPMMTFPLGDPTLPSSDAKWRTDTYHSHDYITCGSHYHDRRGVVENMIDSRRFSLQVPVIYWLSGLTCTEQNFITKAGAQNFAQKYGVAIVCPDTSPSKCPPTFPPQICVLLLSEVLLTQIPHLLILGNSSRRKLQYSRRG